MKSRPELRLFVVLLILHVLCSSACTPKQKANAKPIGSVKGERVCQRTEAEPCLCAKDYDGCRQRMAGKRARYQQEKAKFQARWEAHPR